MTTLLKNKTFVTFALTVIIFTPFISTANYHTKDQSDDRGFFSNVATTFSAIKEDGKALVLDTSSGGAIIFQSFKDVFGKVAQSFYQAVSSFLPDNQELATEETTTTKQAPTNKFFSFMGGLFSGVKESVLSIFSQEESVPVATEEPKIEIPARLKEPLLPKIITEPINQPASQSKNESPRIIERSIELVI